MGLNASKGIPLRAQRIHNFFRAQNRIAPRDTSTLVLFQEIGTERGCFREIGTEGGCFREAGTQAAKWELGHKAFPFSQTRGEGISQFIPTEIPSRIFPINSE